MIVHSLHHFLQTFFNRHLFERLVCYVFVTELLIKVIFELAMGQSFFLQSQNKQILFYGLVMLDYAITLPRLVNMRLRFNYMVLFLLIFIFMIVQGMFVGILNSNRPFEIFNDTVPLLVMALNALRMQSYGEGTRPVQFRPLLSFCAVTGVIICLTGQIGILAGLPSQANVGALTGGIYFPMFFAALLTGVKIQLRYMVIFLIILGFSAMNMNRTSLAFILLAGTYFILLTSLRNPAKGMLVAVLTFLLLGIGWSLLPEESGTYQRIIALGSLNFDDTSGSIGERRNEMRSISRDLENAGLSAEMFGFGHGALYEVQSTHQYIKDYGHAHYSWALYNLRYGMSGYIYLAILALVLVCHTVRNLWMWTPTSVTIALMCVLSFMYLGTYVNFVFLLAGLQFFYLSREEGEQEVREHR